MSKIEEKNLYKTKRITIKANETIEGIGVVIPKILERAYRSDGYIVIFANGDKYDISNSAVDISIVRNIDKGIRDSLDSIGKEAKQCYKAVKEKQKIEREIENSIDVFLKNQNEELESLFEKSKKIKEKREKELLKNGSKKEILAIKRNRHDEIVRSFIEQRLDKSLNKGCFHSQTYSWDYRRKEGSYYMKTEIYEEKYAGDNPMCYREYDGSLHFIDHEAIQVNEINKCLSAHRLGNIEHIKGLARKLEKKVEKNYDLKVMITPHYNTYLCDKETLVIEFFLDIEFKKSKNHDKEVDALFNVIKTIFR